MDVDIDIYKKKYKKYKHKYLELKYGSGSNNNLLPYAVVCLCMLKDHYVIGACICAFVHKYMISLQEKKIKLVVMCDDYIYTKWNDVLQKYFDEVIKIDLIPYGVSDKYQYSKTKYDWMQYAPNKWQCLKFIKYSKILFCDVDILPIDTKFYEIFNYQTPAIYAAYPYLNSEQIQLKKNNCKNGHEVEIKNSFNSYSQYINDNTRPIGSLDGGLILLQPNMDTYEKYLKFLSDIYDRGSYSIFNSGTDETSLFYYLSKHTKLYNICKTYAVIPWESTLNDVKNAQGYNFLSFIKPWIKGRIYQWDEERIWSDLFDAMVKDKTIENKKLEKLYNEQILMQYTKFNQMKPKEKQKYFYNKNFNIINDDNILSYNDHKHQYGILDIKQLHGVI